MKKSKQKNDLLSLIKYAPSPKAEGFVKGKFNKQNTIKLLQQKTTDKIITLTYNDIFNELNIKRI